jgi:ABC-type Fe3+/spermidine/putrescine transport system ATPase subunit
MTPVVELKNVSKRYGAFSALDGVDLSINLGELVALIGPSGAGKSTLIRLVSGEERPTEGTVWLQGRDVTKLPPAQRNVAVVYQDYSLFPHMTVARNIGFPIEARQASKRLGLLRWLAGRADNELVRNKVEACLATVSLGGFAGRMPDQLSGGEKQRAAIARALAMEPEIICFDEPFSALDMGLRRRLRDQVSRVKASASNAFLYVTHNVEEALALADRVAVLIDGELVQVDRPRDIYFRPATRRVAELTGDCSFLTVAKVLSGGEGATVRSVGGATLELACGKVKPGDQIGIRPEIVAFDTTGRGLGAIVRSTAFEGPFTRIALALNESELIDASVPSHSSRVPETGTELFLRIDRANCFVVA